jgi:hypothetical protein
MRYFLTSGGLEASNTLQHRATPPATPQIGTEHDTNGLEGVGCQLVVTTCQGLLQPTPTNTPRQPVAKYPLLGAGCGVGLWQDRCATPRPGEVLAQRRAWRGRGWAGWWDTRGSARRSRSSRLQWTRSGRQGWSCCSATSWEAAPQAARAGGVLGGAGRGRHAVGVEARPPRALGGGPGRDRGVSQSRGVGFRCLRDSAIDTTTPAGELVFHIFAALAQFEREMIRERTLAGLAAAHARGKSRAATPSPRSRPRSKPPADV